MDIAISMTPDGQVKFQVGGNQNKALIVGVLEIVKATLLASKPPQETPPILLAQGSLPRNGSGILR